MSTAPQGDASVVKWVCLLVAVVALSVFGWMLNDIRLQVRGVTERVDKQLPPILERTDQMTRQLDDHLPAILADTETAADTFADAARDLEATRGLLGRGQASGQNKEEL